MLVLYFRGQFAAYRNFVAGWYRPSAPFVTPSAAYGLVLNVAGIESRLDDGTSTATVTRPGLPTVRLALGALRLPSVATLFQQLHNYPVGNSGVEWREQTKGSKYNIQPVWREILVGIEGYIALEAEEALQAQVRRGLRGEIRDRYGLPFLGDNNYLIDVLREEASPRPAHWFERVAPDASVRGGPPARLTEWIDRTDSSRTRAALYRTAQSPASEIPSQAWTQLPP